MKQFNCPQCGCKRFWRVRFLEMIVDFGQEGAIEGHPKLGGPETAFQPVNFRCAECDLWIPENISAEMEAEVL